MIHEGLYKKLTLSNSIASESDDLLQTGSSNLNYKPVIGILSHPGDGASGRLNNDKSSTYIAASYVKFAEAGGARVIPLIYNEPEEFLFQKLELVNGVIFTGGWAKKFQYFEILKKIFYKALERNDAGEHFPVYGICLGFELMSIIISQKRDILERFDAEDNASSLQFVENVNIDGTLFQRFPPDLLKKLNTDCLVMQKHKYGITPENFRGDPALSSFFDILTTCVDENNKKLELVNGVIFTGGWEKEGLYYDMVKKIFNRALERNDAGEHFPVYAICLGFELVSMIISQNRDILEKVDAKNSASSLQFVENFDSKGTVFQRFPPELLKKLGTDCLVMQNHQYGISPGSYESNIALSSFFNVITACIDGHGKAYVSTVQSKRYPVTGFQWHPDKNAFEWGSSKIPHSEDAIQVTQLVANYLVSEARKSLNRPSSDKVLSNLIYNYKPTYCGYAGRGYDEVYIFTQPRSHL